MSDEVPEGWCTASGEDLFSFVTSGSRGWAKYYSEQGPGFLRVGNLNRDTIRLDLRQVPRVKPPRGAEGLRTRVRPGDILISITADVGMVGVASEDLGEVYVNQHLALARPVGAFVPEYIAWYLAGREGGQRQFRDLDRGAIKSGLSLDDIRAVQVPLAPLPEQHRIVEKVEAVLARVNAARERLAKVSGILKRFRQAVLAAACSGRLTEEWRGANTNTSPAARLVHAEASADMPDAEEDADDVELPETWIRARVDGLVEIQNGQAFPSKQYLDRGIRLLRPGNLHVSGRVEWNDENTACLPGSWAKECPEFMLGSGELVMNLTAQSLKDEFLGRVCIKADPVPALLNQRIARFKNITGFDVRPYLFLYFKSKYFRSFVNELDTGSLIRHMHSKDVARHVVYLPPLEEQHEIVRRVQALFGLADTIARRVAAATARTDKLTQAVLAKAFMGELVPTEAELAKAEGREYESAAALLARIGSETASSTRTKNGPRRSPSRRRSKSASNEPR